MTTDQRKMAFAELRPVLQRMRALNPALDEKAARAAVTRKAIGKDKSWGSAAWSQKEFDALLGIIWALAHADDLNLQLRQVEQPLRRAEASVYAQTYLDAICAAAVDRGEQDLVHRLSSADGRERYLASICRRIHKCELVDIDDGKWQDVLSALHHTWQHKEGIEHTHRPKEKDAAADGGRDMASRAPASGVVERTGEPRPAPVRGANPF